MEMHFVYATTKSPMGLTLRAPKNTQRLKMNSESFHKDSTHSETLRSFTYLSAVPVPQAQYKYEQNL